MKPTRSTKRIEKVLTPAEIQKIERNKLIKNQFQIFQELYPEYVERNSIRYPIPDALIAKMPELHGGIMKKKPALMKINVPAEDFERVLYIWEFCNNFNEFLGTPLFKIEELQVCLSYDPETDPRTKMSFEELSELDYTDQIELRHIQEKGFFMVNRLTSALVENYLKDLFPEDQPQGM